ncbi:hypothetical protein CHS0354_024935 [Potamilus streckersoni]|uniref:CARD domain-containing protein n=1 Tax=Potamilus streckersoni TaxID=2493646 RepID=A0AAE0S452_9BIVA|nr:hypothetical protein CHS0354_024935 [Potamilus streckersoni]
MNQVQKLVLQKNHRLLVDTLDLSGSNVLDKLLEEDVISSGEQEDIISRVTSRDQNTRLLFVLKRRGPSKKPFDTFLRALQPDYRFIVDKLKTNEESFKNCYNGKEIQAVCHHCLLKKNLIPNDVSHFLYEEGIISDDELEDINNKNIPRQERVCTLLRVLVGSPDLKLANEKFRSSLEPKYGYILSDIKTDGLDHFMACCCQSESTSKAGVRTCEDNLCETLTSDNEYYSCAEIEHGQETSDDEYYSCEEMYQANHCLTEKRIHGRDSESRIGDVNALGDKDYIIDLNNRKGRCTRIESRRLLLNTSRSERAGQGFLEKTKQDQRRNIRGQQNAFHEQEFPEILLTTSRSNHDSQVHILQHIPKVIPNDKRLMRLCTKLWNKLFFLREKGDWETFNLVSKKAFEKFDDNPDIKVLLYRSEMCVSTFYKNDPSKACDMFDKALEILPKTSMSNWHLSRILPLKMELCTQAKKFEEASSLLEQAHQAMMTLSPCLSTGAVYFFEAMYLGTILRCTAKGTKSAKSIAERVKTCFLTAINHYQQEQFFGIKSFLNQVYLFLALFCLGVDFKKIRYIETRIVSETDISLAEYYLNLFENNCWEDSTNWSQMLFFIARGEHHKQRHNFKRSLDYFQEARKCSVLGSFEEHIGFIDMNLQFVSDKLEEQIRHREIQSQSADAILQSLLENSDSSSSGEN